MLEHIYRALDKNNLELISLGAKQSPPLVLQALSRQAVSPTFALRS